MIFEYISGAGVICDGFISCFLVISPKRHLECDLSDFMVMLVVCVGYAIKSLRMAYINPPPLFLLGIQIFWG